MLAVAGAADTLTVTFRAAPAISTVAGGLGCLGIAALIGLLLPAFARYRSGIP